jgi:hypothetical protein
VEKQKANSGVKRGFAFLGKKKTKKAYLCGSKIYHQ